MITQGFLGADKILEPSGKLLKVKQKRVGILGMKAPAREHTEIYTADGVSDDVTRSTTICMCNYQL